MTKDEFLEYARKTCARATFKYFIIVKGERAQRVADDMNALALRCAEKVWDDLGNPTEADDQRCRDLWLAIFNERRAVFRQDKTKIH